MENKDLKIILRKLLGIPIEIFEEYFENKYQDRNTIRNTETKKTLPFSKRLDKAVYTHIDEKTKKLDLDILFLASFHDMSNQFTYYLYDHHINPETIHKNYKNLTKNPMIQQM